MDYIIALLVIEKDKKIELVYVPSHLYHMAFELYKVCIKFFKSIIK